jgi:predicted CXXCH cytochrome family protein
MPIAPAKSNLAAAAAIILLTPAGIFLAQTRLDNGEYAAPESCAGCHRQIWESYRKTAMGRSFSQPPAAILDAEGATFYQKASDSYFTMGTRDGKLVQRRYQIDPAGRQINGLEKQVDFVLGSGNHARTFLHRTARNTLIELPLGWYAEKGGSWGMNPGYDRPDHDGFRRTISYDCFFCHNAYPRIPAGHDRVSSEPVYEGTLPQGIDCQRCHGPGRRHAELAKTAGAKAAEVRGAIVNPARLSGERREEVCMQCHLETTSFPLPNSLRRFERGPFAYRPGQPLSADWLFFDHAPEAGRGDKFEFVNQVYRMRQSACFLKSRGALGCTTCHDPHDTPQGTEAVRKYDAACRGCHRSGFDHPQSSGCADCHMPKRRTEDVVHVVATDHRIQRRKPAGDLLAEIPERHETGDGAYRGEVVLYYPEKLAATPENELYLALAQVVDRSNTAKGAPRLAAAIERRAGAAAEFSIQLGEAWRNNGNPAKALAAYRDAVRRDPGFAPGWQKLGAALRRAGQLAEAAEALQRAPADDPATWQERGLTYQAQGRTSDASAALEKAIALDPDLPEPHNNLGILRMAGGDRAQAEAAFREAIRIQPDYADAHSNLGNLLAGSGNLAEARYHFETALRLRPRDAATRYNFAMALGRAREFDGAQQQLEAAIQTDPGFADAHLVLADLLMARGQSQAAVGHYREAVRLRPESARALVGLGTALAASGDVTGAVSYLQKAAAGSDPAARERASELLRQLRR